MTDLEQRTYQARFSCDSFECQGLQEMAQLFSRVERSLLTVVNQGQTTASVKNTFLKRFQVTARQFNACRVGVEGKIASYSACRNLHIDELLSKSKKLEKTCKYLEKKKNNLTRLHHKKRALNRTQHRLQALIEEKKAKKTSLCFGGRRLFRAQYNLQANGFANHKEWKRAWKAKRDREFFLLGSKDENMGNQSCVAHVQEDGKISLSLRVPPALEPRYGKHILLKDLYFSYGHQEILASLDENLERKRMKKLKSESYKQRGLALSYRFIIDEKGWQVFVSTALQKPKTCSRENHGVIGIDLNANHIACVETDRFGNPIKTSVLPWVTYGHSKNQVKAQVGEVCKTLVDWAEKVQKPLVVENLDFRQKKRELASTSSKQARMLSSFSYGIFRTFLQSRSYRKGIQVHTVNPAYTSVIGGIKFSKRYGMSSHCAAALCIGRRYQRFSEKPPCHEGSCPDGKGRHVTLSLPDWNRDEHVWRFWAKVKKKMRTVLAAHFQAIKYRSLSPPLRTS